MTAAEVPITAAPAPIAGQIAYPKTPRERLLNEIVRFATSTAASLALASGKDDGEAAGDFAEAALDDLLDELDEPDAEMLAAGLDVLDQFGAGLISRDPRDLVSAIFRAMLRTVRS